jgi:hypothetical protein
VYPWQYHPLELGQGGDHIFAIEGDDPYRRLGSAVAAVIPGTTRARTPAA